MPLAETLQGATPRRLWEQAVPRLATWQPDVPLAVGRTSSPEGAGGLVIRGRRTTLAKARAWSP